MLQKILQLLFGSKNERDLKKLKIKLHEIQDYDVKVQKMSNKELQKQTQKFKDILEKAPDHSASINEILPEAFATTRESAWRILGMRHFDVQMIGAMVLDQGKIAEMKTGEGKTLTATAAVYINALAGKGVHIITVNDYLAKRDAEWMKPLYEFLGLEVGIIQHNMSQKERRKAYRADITYGTNSEFGFDYLRDNMVTEKDQNVQRGFYFGIVDEVDSILIDEARTPLIISGPTEENTGQYINIDRAISHLIGEEKKAPEPAPAPQKPGIKPKPEEPHVIRGYYYDLDEKARNVFLTEEGVHKLEEILGTDNLFSPENVELVAHSSQALRAHLIFKDEVDYVVNQGEVVLIDEHTGRSMPGRRYGDGLHQAIEAKEKVEIKQESQTLASITYQNFFRSYEKLSGMTGTADTEAEEFKKIYNLDVVIVPTNVPIQRLDHPDRIYCTEEEKYEAILKEVQSNKEKGQPMLVGTISIEKSETLSHLFKKAGIAHNVLNARQHSREAEIIANAGKIGAVTIATNMAGRGTDIVLGGAPHYLEKLEESEDNESTEEFRNLLIKKKFNEAKKFLEEKELSSNQKQNLKDVYDNSQIWLTEHTKVKEVGGLHILGTERHEARRIDNQLRGRSGRQGDPGSSRFYLSLEDHLMRIFGGERIKNIMSTLGMQKGQELEAKMVDRSIARAQKRVEGHNFDIRKHLLEYDEVMNKQREFIYNERKIILENKNVRQHLESWFEESIESHILQYCESRDTSAWLISDLTEWLKNILLLPIDSIDTDEIYKNKNPQLALFEKIAKIAKTHYSHKVKEIGEEAFNYVERRITLDIIDARWKEHLHQMDQLREGVWASGYAEKNPLVEFKLRGFEFFDIMVENVKEQVTEYLFRVQIEASDLEMESRSAPSEITMNEQHKSYNSFQENSPKELLNAKSSPRPPSSVTTSGGGASKRKKSRRRRRR